MNFARPILVAFSLALFAQSTLSLPINASPPRHGPPRNLFAEEAHLRAGLGASPPANIDFNSKVNASAPFNCTRIVRISVSEATKFETLYISSSSTGSCVVRAPLVSDDGDFFLWHWCQFQNNAGGTEVVLRNHKTGKFLAASGGSITCGATTADVHAMWRLDSGLGIDLRPESELDSRPGYIPRLDVNLCQVPKGVRLPLAIQWCTIPKKSKDYPPTSICTQLPGPHCADIQIGGNWNTEDAISVPVGQWIEGGSASTPNDSYETETTYTKAAFTSSTTSFSQSFTVSVEHSFKFMGSGESYTFTSTTAFEMSKTTSRTLTETYDKKHTNKCPSTVCDGTKHATIWQWQMTADVAGETNPLVVTDGGNVIFAWEKPKCPPPLCVDVQCQTCRKG